MPGGSVHRDGEQRAQGPVQLVLPPLPRLSSPRPAAAAHPVQREYPKALVILVAVAQHQQRSPKVSSPDPVPVAVARGEEPEQPLDERPAAAAEAARELVGGVDRHQRR